MGGFCESVQHCAICFNHEGTVCKLVKVACFRMGCLDLLNFNPQTLEHATKRKQDASNLVVEVSTLR
eukprot:1429042-Amphidinium_carterae.1